MNLQDALQTFLVEARELLDDMEAMLLRVGAEPGGTETLNAIFRAAHTIKGSAGLFGLDAIVEFTHVVESLLDEVRAGQVNLGAPLVQLLLASADHIGALVDAADSGAALEPQAAAEGQRLVAQLAGYAAGGIEAAATHVAAAAAPANGERRWRIALRFGADVLRNGMDPLSFIRYLSTLGTVDAITTLDDRLPALADLDAESCHLGFEIAFRGAVDRAAIAAVFEFVAEDSEIRIEEEGAPAPATPVAAPEAAMARAGTTREAAQSIRVEADKLDRLINLVGELIIATAGASLLARRSQQLELQECHSVLSHLVEEVRDSALQLRMVKIGGTFGKFQRVVHDVALELGKDIALRISGEDTELDKTVVEKIGDPLMHLVRNAMDHGIDSAELRAARGKPVQGTVSLNAFHDSGSIVIQVGDDGGGLDRERILAKATERGLVEPGKVLTDAETYALIFEPGFSTAEKITNLSGRGVGMDVVKRNIEALRGSVDIASEPGRGTTVTVRLPLTLAIINGFQVAVGKAVFVVPLELVDECVEFSAEPGRDYTDLRGEVLPFIRLRELFEVAGEAAARQNIVVVRHAGQRVGLVVDALLGETQAVIKPLSRVFAQVQGISGSSILGSGEVALILDVPVLLRVASAAELHQE
ncbi:chemotaxis protein CheA [Ramlibacter sp. G-1-2-2]|uniref:Chemotaxis protein CheA n=1 Tax=Ramlibacter agri TaxID=2728837 RepID=A0A848HGN2_9BURK|nr:chemotaxis protein CheA [Ramlibacter agri]